MNQPPYPPHGQPPYGGPPPGQSPYGQPPYGGPSGPPSARKASTGPIIAVIVLAVLIVGALVTLWATGMFDGRGTTAATTPPSTVTPVAPAPPSPAPVPAQTGAAMSEEFLLGTWGVNCPGSRAGSLEFRADGTLVSTEGNADWTLSGNTVTTVGDGVTEATVWTPTGQDSASVSIPNVGTVVFRRCS